MKATTLLLLALAFTAGCTAIQIESLPDNQWRASYRTFLKDVKADSIVAQRDPKDGALKLDMKQYESTETKALETANKALDLAAKAAGPLP